MSKRLGRRKNQRKKASSRRTKGNLIGVQSNEKHKVALNGQASWGKLKKAFLGSLLEGRRRLYRLDRQVSSTRSAERRYAWVEAVGWGVYTQVTIYYIPLKPM